MSGPAPGFDRWLRDTPIGRFYAWLQTVPGSMVYNTPAFKLHEELQVNAGNRILDIGCGRGSLMQLLSAHVALERPPVGIDTSRELLELSTADQAALIQAAPTDLPFAGETFNLVTCGHVTGHLDETALLAFFREVRRVLDPGGIALVWDFAATRSPRLNLIHRRVLVAAGGRRELRNYTTLSAYALAAGFEWVSNAHLRPFLFPPIPRVSIIVGKAPIGWQPEGVAEGLVPDTHSRSLIAGVSQESATDHE